MNYYTLVKLVVTIAREHASVESAGSRAITTCCQAQWPLAPDHVMLPADESDCAEESPSTTKPKPSFALRTASA